MTMPVNPHKKKEKGKGGMKGEAKNNNLIQQSLLVFYLILSIIIEKHT